MSFGHPVKLPMPRILQGDYSDSNHSLVYIPVDSSNNSAGGGKKDDGQTTHTSSPGRSRSRASTFSATRGSIDSHNQPIYQRVLRYSQASGGQEDDADEDPDDVDDLLKDMTEAYPDQDHVQHTVTSFGGLSIDTQDSARYENAPFPSGNIQFYYQPTADVEPKRHYVCIPTDNSSEEVAHFMGSYWKMRSPKIVLSVISGVKHYKAWKNHRLKEQFQKGIIKAANTTEMWIITSGVDGGVSKMIGDAVREEKARRVSNQSQMNKIKPDLVEKFKKLVVIGVVPKDGIRYGDNLDGSEGVIIKNEGHTPKSDQYELNPDHTHFVVVDEEDTDRMFFTNIRCSLEKEFEFQLGRPRRMRRVFSWGSDENDQDLMYDTPAQKTIPVIGLLVQGSPKGIDHVLFYLKNKMPVVVLKGSGGLADLIAYAYEELQERTDPDFEETFLKPELLKHINKTYPVDYQDNNLARNEFRDKILECVGLSSEDDQIFLTIVNMQGWDANLKDLDKYLLRALFKSEKQVVSKWREQLHKDLQLILDWNRPDLARSEIFQRDDFCKIKLNTELMEQALLKKDREEFVEIFLDQGVQVHKFLNHKKFKILFEKAEDREFFTTICLEGILGLSEPSDFLPLEKDFLATDLNRLISKLTGIKDFVQPYELSMNSVGLYVLDPAVAERKALNCLTIWAVLMNRHKLAKVLWQRCDEPIALALICSNLYLELSKFCRELYLRTEMEDNANDFGQIALGVLDISFRESSAQTYSILSMPLSDFGNKTTVEIAHTAGNMDIIAHQCCQKWLTKKLYGSIQVKELNWGVFRLPYWLKILASVMLVFPMFFWISFHSSAQRKRKGISMSDSVFMEEDHEEESSSDSNDDDEEMNIPSSKSMLENELGKIRKKSMTVRIKSALKTKKIRKIDFLRQVYLLWSAPITKFWLTQLFYFIYLGIFCLAVLWPTCGNLYLDIGVWMWTAVILTELVRRTYIKHQKYKAFSLFGHCLEIGLIMVFLILYLFLRIIPHWLNYADINAAKTVLSVGLIYFFYRLLGTYLPISPTLGPMLVRMTRMVKHDFVAFIRMFLIFLISGGVTIQAVLYPNYPLGIDLIKRVLTRPLFAMFLTKIDDLDGTGDCNSQYTNVTPAYCVTASTWSGSHSSTDPRIVPLQKCPYPSLGGYLIVIQYLLICKLVLVTLLFAMFALTITKVDTQASEIWKFQRYALIVDFEEKLILPPPLTVISYLIMVFKIIYRKVTGCCKLSKCCSKKERKNKFEGERMVHRVQRIKRSEDYNYWKKCAREYITIQETKQKDQLGDLRQTESIASIQEDIRQHKKNMKRLNNRIVELERIMLSSKMYLENIFHKLDKTDVLGVQNIKGQVIHVAARQSPYPGTRFARFPVFDKYVPWEQVYDVYDPKIYTKPKDQFTEDEVIFVDEDLIQLKKLREERDLMTEEEKEDLPPLPHISPMWNAVISYKVETNTRAVDRRSWISFDNQPLRYRLDPIGLPLNPMGRTGVRGKGVLWRWGPNHVIKAVCTRWRHKYSDTGDAQTGYLYVEGKRVLEFIAVKKVGEGDMESIYGLPGGALHGHISPYSAQCEAFTKGVLDDNESGTSNCLDQADMIQFFAQFATQANNQKTSFSLASPSPGNSQILQSVQSRTSSRTSLRAESDFQGFSATLLYKGYVDDPRNTDNAWVEAEVWNFHYDLSDTFDVSIPEDSTAAWKDVSPNVKLFGNEGAIVQEAARIHDAYH